MYTVVLAPQKAGDVEGGGGDWLARWLHCDWDGKNIDAKLIDVWYVGVSTVVFDASESGGEGCGEGGERGTSYSLARV